MGSHIIIAFEKPSFFCQTKPCWFLHKAHIWRKEKGADGGIYLSNNYMPMKESKTRLSCPALTDPSYVICILRHVTHNCRILLIYYKAEHDGKYFPRQKKKGKKPLKTQGRLEGMRHPNAILPL